MAKNTSKRPAAKEVATFKLLSPMLDSLLEEVREFSKKKPDGALNKLKVGMINRILTQIKNILVNDPSGDYLDLLDDETLPMNSDAVLVLGQYRAAMDQFESKHRGTEDSKRGWYSKTGFIPDGADDEEE